MSTIDIVLDDPDKVYTFGDTISGTVRLFISAAIRLEYVQIELQGVTTALYYKAHEKRDTNDYRFTVRHLALNKKLISDVSVPTGYHSFKFSMKLPRFCYDSDEKLPAYWHIPLPSSFSIGYAGGVSYKIEAKAKASSFKETLIGSRDFTFLGLSNPYFGSSEYKERTTITESAPINLYNQKEGSWIQWAAEKTGLSTPDASFPVRLELVHSAAGLPSLDIPFADVVSTKIILGSSDEKGKPLSPLVVSKISANINYSFLSRLKDGSTVVSTFSVNLVDKSLVFPVEFKVDTSGANVCDISSLFTDVQLKREYLTQTTPVFSASAELAVDVHIRPTTGNPIRQTEYHLVSPVQFLIVRDPAVTQLITTRTLELPPYVT